MTILPKLCVSLWLMKRKRHMLWFSHVVTATIRMIHVCFKDGQRNTLHEFSVLNQCCGPFQLSWFIWLPDFCHWRWSSDLWNNTKETESWSDCSENSWHLLAKSISFKRWRWRVISLHLYKILFTHTELMYCCKSCEESYQYCSSLWYSHRAKASQLMSVPPSPIFSLYWWWCDSSTSLRLVPLLTKWNAYKPEYCDLED